MAQLLLAHKACGLLDGEKDLHLLGMGACAEQWGGGSMQHSHFQPSAILVRSPTDLTQRNEC
ncbi:hypothetical protein BO86DRAFT_385855 [Aspergillus japonicus CBS 114.51]|uniref:Uncharacterized protein n=1 Tax=Aspergillus japonicus CBS 114.51 TaxID=1448312 RepID=A0A8T8XBT3_ASPJA|nr:hypothetical protein BO86DRAFT_385855 [Aspergillus japonicus CBS 114.51]RAH85545.1 hypothetical protein BO86DRAFT_385855 [Aspergillus japonicus CBS 114.51]